MEDVELSDMNEYMNESHLVSLQFKKQVLKRKNESFSFLHVHSWGMLLD